MISPPSRDFAMPESISSDDYRMADATIPTVENADIVDLPTTIIVDPSQSVTSSANGAPKSLLQTAAPRLSTKSPLDPSSSASAPMSALNAGTGATTSVVNSAKSPVYYSVPTSPNRSIPVEISTNVSPTNGHTNSVLTKDEKQAARLIEVLDATPDDVSRAIFKARWRDLLFDGTQKDDHSAFLLRAGLKNATNSVIDRILNEESLFKARMVQGLSRKKVILETVLKQADVDQVTDFVHDRVLDRILAKRIASLSARDLVGLLAQAGRLGYKHDDIIDEGESVRPNISHGEGALFSQPPPTHLDTFPRNTPVHQPEAVPPQALPSSTIQQQAPRLQQSVASQPPNPLQSFLHQQYPSFNGSSAASPGSFAPPSDPLLAEQERNRKEQHEQQAAEVQRRRSKALVPPTSGQLMCHKCGFIASFTSGYNFHTQKRVCEKVAPVGGFKCYCHICGQGFTTKQALNYHNIRKVCETDDIAPASCPDGMATPPSATQPTAAFKEPSQTLHQHPRRPTNQFTLPTSPQPSPKQIVNPPLEMPITSTNSKPNNVVRTQSLGSDSSNPDGVRGSPSSLSDAKRAHLNSELALVELRYQQRVFEAMSLPEAEKAAKFVTLKNGRATRKSQIRKAFGVSLRPRDRYKSLMQIGTREDTNLAGKPDSPAQSSSSQKSPVRFQDYVASSQQTPTSAFSPINPHNLTRPNIPSPLNATFFPREQTSESPLQLFSQPASQRPLQTQDNHNHNKKRLRSQSPSSALTSSSISAYYDAHPPRHASPFNARSQEAIDNTSALSSGDESMEVRDVVIRNGVGNFAATKVGRVERVSRREIGGRLGGAGSPSTEKRAEVVDICSCSEDDDDDDDKIVPIVASDKRILANDVEDGAGDSVHREKLKGNEVQHSDVTEKAFQESASSQVQGDAGETGKEQLDEQAKNSQPAAAVMA